MVVRSMLTKVENFDQKMTEDIKKERWFIRMLREKRERLTTLFPKTIKCVLREVER